MTTKNRYKFTFGDKPLTLTTDKDNLFMEEVERVAREKYKAIKRNLPEADNETIAILMAINTLSTQLSRELVFEETERELERLRTQKIMDIRDKTNQLELELSEEN
ncbi:cell division protein ZapA [Streptococcus plurextorum]|uniref:cell division protein ZapA n=1 Tax=Streptococcus plurextorum TaxID=456876 RepID=UPI00040DA84E|nr:cell division protein ZapA [Streptococcus plurextorum]